MIIKTKKGFEVVSPRTGRNFGVYKTLKKADKRIQQVEYFKFLKKKK